MLKTSYFKAEVDENIPFTVYAHKYCQLLEEPDKPLIKYISVCNDEIVELSLYEYHHLVDCLGYAFYSVVNLQRKDVIGIYLPNCIQFIISSASIETCGFIMIPLNPAYKPDQLERLFCKTDVKLVVTTKALVPNVIKANKSMKIVVVDSTKEDITNFSSQGINVYSYEDLIKVPLNKEFLDNQRNQISSEDVLFYGCTSGSTGEPKICVYTNRAFVGNICSNQSFFPIEKRVSLSFAPLYTTTGHIIVSFIVAKGYYYIFLDKFDVEKIFQIIEENHVTSTGGAPSAFMALMKHPNRTKYNLSSLKEVTIGGAIASNELTESVKRVFNLQYSCSGFGMTETCGIVYKMPAKSTGYSARLTKNYEVRVVDHETREVLPIGIAGELEIKSPFILKEYLNNPEANKQAFTKDGWFRTGDEAVLDADKFLRITGRVKDMIIRGGHNIWPAEICDIMVAHPKIQEAAVIGIPDKIQGETLVAFVIVKSGSSFTNLEMEMKEYLTDKLVPFSIPTYIFQLQEMPRTSFGKVYVPKLKEIVKDLIKKRWEILIQENNDPPITEVGKEVANIWSEFFDIPVGALSRKSNFYDLGGDSFVGAQTVAIIRKYIPNAPFNLLSLKVSLGDIEDYVSNPVLCSNENEELTKDFNWVQRANIHELFNKVVEPTNENIKRDSAIVTGATGYLGLYITLELCKRSDIKKVYCVGRSSNKNELSKKMRLMLRKTEKEWNDKIEMVIGDISKEDFGIEDSKKKEMQSSSKIIINCAAIVNWTKTYNQLKLTNAFGVLNVINFAGQDMNICQISTLGAALNKDESISDNIPLNAFGYVQSKWMGEQICKRGIEEGYKINIMRPSFVVSDSNTGICNTDDFIYKMIRLSIKNNIGLIGPSFPMTPVDKLAECIVNNMYNQKTIINLIPTTNVSTENIFSICQLLNMKITLVNETEWKKKVTDYAQNGDKEALQLLASLNVLDLKGPIESKFFKFNPKENILDFTNDFIKINLKKLQSVGFFNEDGCSLLSRCN
ncbi:acyl-coA synthetase, putative [Entamoeba histolytica HM-1:IMSS-B]|uniref:Acyl-coA synthetase, putative n=6 Tax=Entamoeba histolytica TaxID=5759 RepID=C4M5D7_ENTH1|nr:acyl-coA synthetase, putative [Entamoeba histolytica HM-1:IMSS]EMD48404.1 4-coumarate-CoA ligase, putative [Entamoeba histolytica KU27]EMH72132.1 acyl-coA synthetase, putative [Entamoeba histolytica HM-1:IMSS-B]EMS12092.1 4-coumarate--CoA ligase [Entamoeba histolytica HM-3:IMSS]ENY60725.1 4-coumarate--CoA ligase, putative [Entamoeba histolytica HM-1:IMSS-A]GAT96637.1 acyl-coa synthetase putative [Entamoeba histolytica]|eukprot:XP_652616.1 acyl-coA synthetase, putative [Entamoeba histolytica HM-1:IMSS]